MLLRFTNLARSESSAPHAQATSRGWTASRLAGPCRGSAQAAPTPDPSIPHIDVDQVSIKELQLGAELAGVPATLAAQGSAHLRTVRDMSKA